jgi:hypothetical protein
MKTIQDLLSELSNQRYSKLSDKSIAALNGCIVYGRKEVEQWHKVFMTKGRKALEMEFGISNKVYTKQFEKFGLSTKSGIYPKIKKRPLGIGSLNLTKEFYDDLLVLSEKSLCEKYGVGKGTVYRERKKLKAFAK